MDTSNPSPLDKARSMIQERLASAGSSSLIGAILRPPPESIDGRYTSDINPAPKESGLLADIASQLGHLPENLGLVDEFLRTEKNDGLQDDKNYLTEQIIQLAVSLPSTSKNQSKLTGALVGKLWSTLQHPPLSYLGEEHKYRSADGSNNNIMYPNLGKAGNSYARTVPPQISLTGAKPDAGVIFDSVLARNGKFKEHPNKISSMLFYFATIIIHDLFSTDRVNPALSASSSYLDLGPLYGNNQNEQNAVRTFKDGLLKPDTFASGRILGFPPGTAALLVAFSRFHNYVVQELAAINESGRFTLPSKNTEATDPEKEEARYAAALKKRDNDLFQTGRLIICGLYINVVLIDYVRVILNLNRTNSSWALDPRGNYDTIFDMEGTPVGIGNQVSAEFNLIYRWHCAISKKDEKWTEDFMTSLFPGKNPEELTSEDLKNGLKNFGHSLDRDPGKWEFGGIKRQQDGAFKDDDLVHLLKEATEDVAGAYGAKNIPNVMRVIELLGIEQSRAWNVASLNEFRKFFGLKPHETFADINDDPDVAQKLEVLYEHPDFVELYPGLLTESAKKPLEPGSGLCPGFTVSRTILSDAVTLVRGDRFYTIDYNPGMLTNWGFAEVASDPKIAGGGVIYKLLTRAFPNHYKGNSVYAMYPFVVPEENHKIHTKLGTVGLYDYGAPKFEHPAIPIMTHAGVTRVLGDQENFKVPWAKNIKTATGHDFMLGGDTEWHRKQHAEVTNALYAPDKGMEEVKKFYEHLTKKLLKEKSFKLGKAYQTDAVRDIGNVSHANFVATLFHIPLKTKDSPMGIFTEQQVYAIFSVLFAYVFLDFNPSVSLPLQLTAVEAVAPLAKVVEAAVQAVQSPGIISSLTSAFVGTKKEYLKDYGSDLIARMSEGGKSVDEVVWEIIPTASGAVATQAQGFAQMLDLFLSDKYSHHWSEIRRLALSDAPGDFEKLRKYALEGYRLATPAFGLVRIAGKDGLTIQDGERTIEFKKGDKVFTNFVSAGLDPNVFPDPHEIKLDRPDSSYIHHGYGPHSCIGRPIVMTAMAAQLKVFGQLKNLRRAPGLQGQLKSKESGAFKLFMKEDWSSWWYFPTTMKVVFDGFEDKF